MAVMTMKRCALCGLELPTDQFGHDGRTRDRLTYRCNVCRAMQTRQTITTPAHFHGEQ